MPTARPDADRALETTKIGIRAVFVSLAALGVTALVELVITLLSGSVALLADTIHNFADALTALPLALAFRIGRRPPPAATPTATAGPRISPASPSWS